MPAFRRVYLDTNIFIKMVEGQPEEADPLLQLAIAAEGNSPFLFTSELTLAELIVRPYAQQQGMHVDSYDGMLLTNSGLTVTPVDRSVFWSAGVVRSRYPSIKLHDAIHLSAAIGLECSDLMTADHDLAGSYQLLDSRHGFSTGSASIDILRPTPDVIDAMIAGLKQ